MRYPNHFHENIDHSEGFGSDFGRGTLAGSDRDFGHRAHHGMGHGQRCEQHQGRGHQHRDHSHEGHRPTDCGQQGMRHEGHGQPGEHPRGGAHRRPTLARSIMKSARRIRQSGLTPEQLHRHIAATVSDADYVTTMRTLRRIGMELRTAQADTER